MNADHFTTYLPLAVMACPQHAGKHPFHDQRWIVTAGTTTEHGHDPRPGEWHTVNGSLVAEMRDTVPGLAAYMVEATNQHAELKCAAAFHKVAVAERDHERHLNAGLRAAMKALRDAAMNTPALDTSPEWTALIQQADAALQP